MPSEITIDDGTETIVMTPSGDTLRVDGRDDDEWLILDEGQSVDIQIEDTATVQITQ